MLFIGIDCSTQSLKLQVIDNQKRVVKETVVNYDQDLPQFGTTNGIIRHKINQVEHISTPSLLFVSALELAFDRLVNEQFDLSQIKAVSGSGQQHGSVWWRKGALELLRKTNDNVEAQNIQSLSQLLNDSFSMQLSPIWMDSSTTLECQEMTEYIGSSQVLADVTGSRAYERFTGPQIKHVIKHQPDVYLNTERISLISSFLPSLFIGDYSPIDSSDASGMNLLDIKTGEWDQRLLDCVAPLGLREKLGDRVVGTDKPVGFISTYWRSKYNFSPDCEIYAFSGDNPCSLIGLGLDRPGDIALSLGTSDVLFAVTDTPKPNANEGSILIHPKVASSYMMMLVYKNGAVTRQRIRDASLPGGSRDWNKFSEAIADSPVGCNGQIGFYYLESEITPDSPRCGIVKFNKQDEMISLSSSSVSNLDSKLDCRSMIESQVLSFKHHAHLLGLDRISSIVVTGGGSVNKQILQIVADVFEIQVRASPVVNTAAYGAALRALDSWSRVHHQELTKSASSSFDSQETQIVTPISQHFSIYRDLFARFQKLESRAVELLNGGQ